MKKYDNFELSIYCTKTCVEGMPDTPEELAKEFSFFTDNTKVSKLYLETYRNSSVSSEKLLYAKKFFNDMGIKTSTGITTVNTDAEGYDNRFGHKFCYTDQFLLDLLYSTFERMASEFDEIMIDDFFCSNCTCDNCRAEKGERTWVEYRLDQMTKISEEIVRRAKKVNPNVNIIIKYPTWREGFASAGYNVETQPFIFDNTYAGTETRDTSFSLFHNPRYTSFSLISWVKSLPPYVNNGGWFDPYMCGNSVNSYLEQAYFTLFSKPKEMTLFCYRSTINTMNIKALGFQLDRIDKILGAVGNTKHVPVYIPRHADGEDHIYDYMGMCGISVEAKAEFQDKSPSMVLTQASLADKDIFKKVSEYMAKGGIVYATNGFHRGLGELGKEFTSSSVTNQKVGGNMFGAYDNGWSDSVDYTYSKKDIGFDYVDFKGDQICFKIVLMLRDFVVPIFFYSYYGKGKYYIINMPDNYTDFYYLPKESLTKIRQIINQDVYIVAPGEISLFNYDNNSVILYSFLGHGAIIDIVVKGDYKTLKNIETGQTTERLYYKDGESVFKVSVSPRDYVGYIYE